MSVNTDGKRARWWAAASSGLAVVLVVLASCGGGDSDDGDGVASVDGDAGDGAEGAGDQASTEEELIAYAQCLREQGVDVPDPEVDENGDVQWDVMNGAGNGDPAQREQLQVAMDACGSPPAELVPGGGGGGGLSPEAQDALLEYSQCMRDNGLEDFPDPGPPGEGPPFGDIDRESPEFEAAHEACEDILASGRDQAPGGDGGADDDTTES